MTENNDNHVFVRPDIKVGDLYEDCAYLPLRCTEVEECEYGDTILGESLLDGTIRSCDIYHCGPRKLTEAEAQELVTLWKTGGERAVMLSRGWTEEGIDKFIAEWR